MLTLVYVIVSKPLKMKGTIRGNGSFYTCAVGFSGARFYNPPLLVLFHFECKHTVVFDKGFQFIANHYFSHTGGCARKDHITDIH